MTSEILSAICPVVTSTPEANIVKQGLDFTLSTVLGLLVKTVLVPGATPLPLPPPHGVYSVLRNIKNIIARLGHSFHIHHFIEPPVTFSASHHQEERKRMVKNLKRL